MTRLIDLPDFPVTLVNAVIAREKGSTLAHPSSFHYYFARRPLSAARVIYFASVVYDPESSDAPSPFVEYCRTLSQGELSKRSDTLRNRLFDFVIQLADWKAFTDESLIQKAQDLIRLSNEGRIPSFLDPFCGGGALPLEAQRLGATVYANDLNPVAVLINRAMLVYPQRFAGREPVNPCGYGIGKSHTQKAHNGAKRKQHPFTGIAADVRYYASVVARIARERIGHLYPTHEGKDVTYYLWQRMTHCPRCGGEVPLWRPHIIDDKPETVYFDLSLNREAKTVQFCIVTDSKATERLPIRRSQDSAKLKDFACPFCGYKVEIRKELKIMGREKRIFDRMVCVVANGLNGKSYFEPTPEQVLAARITPPNIIFPKGVGRHAPFLYGYERYDECYTPRQLSAINAFHNAIQEVERKAYDDAVKAGLPADDDHLRDGGVGARAYAQLIRLYLSFALNKATNYWTSFTRWTKHRGVDHSMPVNVVPMAWDYGEMNPFVKKSPPFERWADLVARSLEFSFPDGKPAIVSLGDARELSWNADVISTDPPYYNLIDFPSSINFFYVWLKHFVGDLFPDLFVSSLSSDVREIAATSQISESKRVQAQHFANGMRDALLAMKRVIPGKYPITVYYAFRDSLDWKRKRITSGWQTFLEAFVQSGMRIGNALRLQTESKGRAVNLNAVAIASSIVFVCYPRHSVQKRALSEVLAAVFRDVFRYLETAVADAVHIQDIPQSCVAKAAIALTQYDFADGLDFDAFGHTIILAIRRFLRRQSFRYDAITRFAVWWLERFGFKAVDMDSACERAAVLKLDLNALIQSGLLVCRNTRVSLVWRLPQPSNGNGHEERVLSNWEVVLKCLDIWQRTADKKRTEMLSKFLKNLVVGNGASAPGAQQPKLELVKQLVYHVYLLAEMHDHRDKNFPIRLICSSIISQWDNIVQLVLQPDDKVVSLSAPIPLPLG